jgi:hypothetical protein
MEQTDPPVDAGIDAPDPGDLERIERALGWRPLTWRRAVARPAGPSGARWIVAANDRSAFVKVGANENMARWFREEHANYLALGSCPFLPTLLGFSDDEERPVLALEDLSRADWPPPWQADGPDRVMATAALVHAVEPPVHLPRLANDHAVDWRSVADDPNPFLRLGLCSGAWLKRALPVLIDAADDASIEGDSLLHMDIRSDNLCFLDERTYLVDWNLASIGNPDVDIAFWLPSLQSEGGPAAEEVMRVTPELASWVASYFCVRAGRPEIREAPHVRALQLAQSRTALPWAARLLGLPPPNAPGM